MGMESSSIRRIDGREEIDLKSRCLAAKGQADPNGTDIRDRIEYRAGVLGGHKKMANTVQLRFSGAALVIWGKDAFLVETKP